MTLPLLEFLMLLLLFCTLLFLFLLVGGELGAPTTVSATVFFNCFRSFSPAIYETVSTAVEIFYQTSSLVQLFSFSVSVTTLVAIEIF